MSIHRDREWEERLETGAEDDELLALAARLRRAGAATRATPSLAFQRQLRRDLLSQYPVAPRRGANVWRWVGSLAAVALLAVVIGLMWFSISSSGRLSFGGAANGQAETAIASLPDGSIYLEMHGYNSTLEALAPGEMLSLNGRWRIPANVANGADLTAFLQLRAEAGAVVAQADGPLTSEYIETRNGREAWWFLLSLALPEDLPPGEYLLVTGLVGADGQRLPVFDQQVGDEIVIGPVTIGQTQDADPKVTVLAVSPTSASSTNDNSGVDSASPTNRLVDYSVNGAVVTETTTTDGSETQTTYLLVPGMTATVRSRWSLATPSIGLAAFVQLLDQDNQVIAQGDAPLEPAVDGADQAPYAATIPITLPAEMPPGTYQLVSGLYDPATGARQPLNFNGSEVMTVTLGQYNVAASSPASGFDIQQLFDDRHAIEHAQLAEAQEDTLLVHEVSPAAGSEISGTAPIEFVVSVDYALVSLPQAILEVRVVEQAGEDGRGVGLATTEVVAGSGTVTLVVLVNPSELPQAADLGLWLQLKPDEASPPTLTTIPEGVGWFYVP